MYYDIAKLRYISAKVWLETAELKLKCAGPFNEKIMAEFEIWKARKAVEQAMELLEQAERTPTIQDMMNAIEELKQEMNRL